MKLGPFVVFHSLVKNQATALAEKEKSDSSEWKLATYLDEK